MISRIRSILSALGQWLKPQARPLPSPSPSPSTTLPRATPPSAVEPVIEVQAVEVQAGLSSALEPKPEPEQPSLPLVVTKPRKPRAKKVVTAPLALPDPWPLPSPILPDSAIIPDPGLPEQPVREASFTNGDFDNAAGRRAYRLFLPAGDTLSPLPLVVMLHGCGQSAEDFALGTGMNTLAADTGFAVLYPEQPGSANPNRCWNWFNTGDQERDGGEPLLIVGMIEAIMADHALDPRRVYVAGLSAGGAMAVILAHAYPDVFAAVGVHSGLPYRAANSFQSAFAAMNRGVKRDPSAGLATRIPIITFHGDSDGVVNAGNADAIVADGLAGWSSPLRAEPTRGEAGGLAYDLTRYRTDDGVARVEQWTLHGLGHGWCGGNPAGSFTDARGINASRTLVDFLFSHSRPSDTTP